MRKAPAEAVDYAGAGVTSRSYTAFFPMRDAVHVCAQKGLSMPLSTVRRVFWLAAFFGHITVGQACADMGSAPNDAAAAEHPAYLNTLKRLVTIESRSSDASGLSTVAELLDQHLNAWESPPAGTVRILAQEPTPLSGSEQEAAISGSR